MIGVNTDPRNVSELDLPPFGDANDTLRLLVNYAVLAPSGHNTQPWLFRIAEGTLDLYADRTRALPVADPDDRELLMSCGAALFHLRLAARHYGYTGDVETFPDSETPDLLTRFRLGPMQEPTVDQERLFRAILTRRTNRQAFEEQPVPASTIDVLKAAVATEGARLYVVQNKERKERLADLIAEGDHRQMKNDAFRAELADWMRRGDNPSRDGMPAYAFGVSKRLDFTTPVAAFLMRRFDMGKGQAAKDHELATGSPLLAVLATDADTPPAWLQAGQALARMLLRVEAEGLSASFLNQPIEEPTLRPQLQKQLRTEDHPQVLLRLGYGPDVPTPTPRRPIDEVLLPATPSPTE